MRLVICSKCNHPIVGGLCLCTSAQMSETKNNCNYPTGQLVKVLRLYKNQISDDETYREAVQELKHLLVSLAKLEFQLEDR